MARRLKTKPEPVRAEITGLSHDCRGVTRIEEKTVFVDGALPGEEVLFSYIATHRNFDEGEVVEVLRGAPERVEPRCPHFGVCGGCSLQHMAPEAQIQAKQGILLDNLRHIGKTEPRELLPPLTGPHWGYRRKARLGAKYVEKKGRVLVGFRERSAPYVAELSQCPVLHPSVGERITELAELIGGLNAKKRIAQIEVAVDETQTALVFRNLVPLDPVDTKRLIQFGQRHDLRLYLQPAGPDSVAPLWPEEIHLRYRHPGFDTELAFLPTDFTQVNYEINRAMVERAMAMLQPRENERILDLFCGLGNFTLPLARHAQAVVGVEGASELVERARANAAANGLDNVEFHAADLAADLSGAPWWRGGFDKVLLDPPRSGAEETLSHLSRLGIGRILYVSCNPATLARDAGILVNDHGYRLESAGVMDMFPHTAHVESIALFTR